MSIYSVHKICHLADKDPAFKDRLVTDPQGTLAEFRLTDEERTALLAGDVRTLHDLGAHGFLLGRLTRHAIFGLDRETYVARMKGNTSG